MDLKNNQIKMGEIAKNDKAREILKKEFPQYISPVMLSMSKNMTLADVIKLAGGRVLPEKITRVIEMLEEI